MVLQRRSKNHLQFSGQPLNRSFFYTARGAQLHGLDTHSLLTDVEYKNTRTAFNRLSFFSKKVQAIYPGHVEINKHIIGFEYL